MNQSKECISIVSQLMLAKSLLDWRENPDMSFRRIFRLNFNQSILSSKPLKSDTLLDLAITNTLSNLVRQTFVTNYEYLRHNIDDKMSAKLKNIRNQTSDNSSNLNTTKFMDAIRQSLAHNDLSNEIPNWKLNNEFKIEINFKGQTFTFDLFQFHTLMNEFLILKKQRFYSNFEINQDNLSKMIFKRKLSTKNIHECIKIYENIKTNELYELDTHQCSALINLFTSDEKISPISHLIQIADNNYFISQKLCPLKHNAGHISYLNNLCFRSLIKLRNNYISRQNYLDASEDFEYDVNLIDETNDGDARSKLLHFIQTENIAFEVTLLTNAMFTMFSISSPNSLAKYFNEYDIDINRLRNALMHGRYFYDCKAGFEFYDGKTNSTLEHVATLSVNQIFSAVGKFIQDNQTTLSSSL